MRPCAVDGDVDHGAVGLVAGPVLQAPAVRVAEDTVFAVGRWLAERHGQMEAAHAATAIGSGQLGGDDRAPVTAACAIALVPNAIHQPSEGGRNTSRSPTRRDCRSGEPIARYRRRHDVERVGGVATVSDRIDQWPDDLDELEDRSRPTVDEQKWKCMGVRRSGMEKVDRLTLDVGPILIEGVDDRFLGAPVERRSPVLAQLAEVRAAYTEIPPVLTERVEVPSPPEPVAEIDQGLFGHGDSEGRGEVHSELFQILRDQVLRARERWAARAPWTSKPAKAAVHAASATANVILGAHSSASSSTTVRILNVDTPYMPKGKTNAQ